MFKYFNSVWVGFFFISKYLFFVTFYFVHFNDMVKHWTKNKFPRVDALSKDFLILLFCLNGIFFRNGIIRSLTIFSQACHANTAFFFFVKGMKLVHPQSLKYLYKFYWFIIFLTKTNLVQSLALCWCLNAWLELDAISAGRHTCWCKSVLVSIN